MPVTLRFKNAVRFDDPMLRNSDEFQKCCTSKEHFQLIFANSISLRVPLPNLGGKLVKIYSVKILNQSQVCGSDEMPFTGVCRLIAKGFDLQNKGTHTGVYKSSFPLFSNSGKLTTVGGPGTPPLGRTRDEFCTVWNSAR